MFILKYGADFLHYYIGRIKSGIDLQFFPILIHHNEREAVSIYAVLVTHPFDAGWKERNAKKLPTP